MILLGKERNNTDIFIFELSCLFIVEIKSVIVLNFGNFSIDELVHVVENIAKVL